MPTGGRAAAAVRREVEAPLPPPPPPPACGVRSWMPGARGGHAEVGEGGAHEEEHHQWEGVPRPLYIVRRRSPLSQ